MLVVGEDSLVFVGLEWEEIESSEGPALLPLQASTANGQVPSFLFCSHHTCPCVLAVHIIQHSVLLLSNTALAKDAFMQLSLQFAWPQ